MCKRIHYIPMQTSLNLPTRTPLTPQRDFLTTAQLLTTALSLLVAIAAIAELAVS